MKPTKKSAKLNQSKNGFSLIEILIVITLVGFLFNLVLPQVRSSREQIKSIFNLLKTDIKSVSNLAIVSGRAYRISFDLKQSQYWLEETNTQNLVFSDFKAAEALERKSSEDISKGLKKMTSKKRLHAILMLIG